MPASRKIRVDLDVDATELRRRIDAVVEEHRRQARRSSAYSYAALVLAFLCVAAYASGSVVAFAAANAFLGPFIAFESYRRRAWGPLLLNVAFTLVGAATLLGWI